MYNRCLGQPKVLVAVFHIATAQFCSVRLILIYLITASMPLGTLPTPELLQMYELLPQYGPLLQPLKVCSCKPVSYMLADWHMQDGNFKAVLKHLDAHRAWHLQKGTYLLLKEKLETICWRNLIRKTSVFRLNIAGSSTDVKTIRLWVANKPVPERSPTLRLDVICKAAQFAFSDGSLDVDDIEAMCASLLEQVRPFDIVDYCDLTVSSIVQGYLKAYIWHARRQIVFQKGPPYGFPKVSSVGAWREEEL